MYYHNVIISYFSYNIVIPYAVIYYKYTGKIFINKYMFLGYAICVFLDMMKYRLKN